MKHICIESFMIEVCDDDGFFTGKENIIKEGTIWEVDKNTNYLGGEVHLERIYKSKKAKSRYWIEITKEHFEKYFAELN